MISMNRKFLLSMVQFLDAKTFVSNNSSWYYDWKLSIASKLLDMFKTVFEEV